MPGATLGLVVTVVAVTIVLGSVSIIYPFGRDQGIHAFIADSMLQGKAVYRDVYNIKPPMTTAVHALALVLFGHSMTSIRLLDLIWTAATALVLALLALRLFRRRWVAALAGMLYSFFYYQFGYWNTSQTDGWIALPVAGAMLLVLQAMARSEARAPQTGSGPGWRWFGAGLLLGCALLTKYTAGVFALLLAGTLLVASRRSLGQAVRALGLAAAGFAVPVAAAFALIAGSGALPAFVESQFGVVPGYVKLRSGGGIAAWPRLLLFLQTLMHVMPSAAIAGAGGLAALVALAIRRRGDYMNLTIVLLLLVGGAASTFAQGKFFMYHYLPLLPALVIAASGGAGVLVRLRPRLVGLPLLAVLTGAVAAVLSVETSYPRRFHHLARVATGRSTVRQYWMSGHEKPDFCLRDDITLADYIRENTKPGDRVFLWGYEPLVYFLSRRPVVSRFIYTYPLVVAWAPAALRQELMDELRQAPATLFVVAHGDSTPHVMGHGLDSYRTLQQFTELRTYVDEHYEPAGEVARFSLFRLRTGE
ncbi:MAG: glycosyltransferase family 39 protein [candidate division WOR-3 bacterium]|nr:MAG: glycosyltransferase family 39 protein [candidate division WOR-3 bacterium]